MSPMRFAVAACFAAVLLACRHAAAAEGDTPSADEPSIEEMFAAIEAHKRAIGPSAHVGQGPPGAPRPAAPGASASRPTAPRPPPFRTSSKPRKPPADVAKELKRIHKRATECFHILRMRKENREIVQLYIRLERFKKAAEVLFPMLRARPTGSSTVQRPWLLGEYDIQYAAIMRRLEQEKTTRVMLAEHRKKLVKARSASYYSRPTPYDMVRINKKLAFFDNYPEARRRVDELEAALAEGGKEGAEGGGPGRPGRAEKLWELAGLCSPGNYKAELPLKWFAALYELVNGHPDYSKVRNGSAHWELHRACRLHRMHEDSSEILTMMLERFPEFYYVENAYCLWELAESHEFLGRHRETLRDRARAVPAYREAIKRYKEFKVEFPSHRNCKAVTSESGRVTPARVNTALDRIQTSLDRMVK